MAQLILASNEKSRRGRIMGEREKDRAAYDKKLKEHKDEIAKESDALFEKYDQAQRGFLDQQQLAQLLSEATEGKGPNPGEMDEVLGFYGVNCFSEDGTITQVQLRKAVPEWRYYVLKRDDTAPGCSAGCQIL